MLTVSGPGSGILFITGGVILDRNQAQEGLERVVVPLKRF
jgi:hypothetical protein